MTFNDEVACRKKIDINLTGAVQATALLSILEKIDDADLLVRDNDKGELEFKGRRKFFGLTKDAEVLLPIDSVEEPDKWYPLPKGFADAVEKVSSCIASDETKFRLTCFHLRPNYIEACNNKSIMRWRLPLKGLTESALVRGKALVHVVGLGVTKMASTFSWVHFRNEDGLIFSCRRYQEDYPDLTSIIKNFQGQKIVIPRGLSEVGDRAVVFAADRPGDPYLKVTLDARRIHLSGDGLSGWYKEVRKIEYDGPRVRFVIDPVILRHISDNYKNARVSDQALRAVGGSDDKGGRWQYITRLGTFDDEKKKERKEKAHKASRKVVNNGDRE